MENSNGTVQHYWTDTYLFQSEAKVIAIESGEKGGTVLTLDSTIFYPQGGHSRIQWNNCLGGQPADSGEIKSSSSKYIVKDVRMKGSQVVHFGLQYLFF